MVGVFKMTENVKMLKVATPLSYASGAFAIASSGNHLSNSQQILQITSNNGNVNNINLVDLGKKLLDACRNGETEEVRNLMQSGAPFTTDWLGTSPLHFAAQYGHAETAELLLRAGVSRDTRTKVDRTPLHAAAQEGHLSIVNLLVVHGADVDAKDLLKMTPLHWAVERGHTDVVECLLTNSADVNAMSKFDKSPIDIALDTGRLDLVPLLQKYIHNQRPKTESKPQLTMNSKVKNTVLPNKSNRTTKIAKPQVQTVNLQQASNQNSKPLIINSPFSKTVNLDAIRKLISNNNNSNCNNNNNNNSESNQVYATLAALAEATTAADALKFLESCSINNSGDNTFIQSAYEGGQTVSLTEAGKLALNWVKEHNNQNSSGTSVTTNTVNHINSNNKSSNNKVITIVADSTQLPQIINSTQATPIVVVSDNESHKLGKQFRVARPISTATVATINQQQQLQQKANLTLNSNNNSSNCNKIIVNKENSQDEVLKLQKELELIKKQAEEYKTQLKEKEKEAQLYKQQLDAMKAETSTNHSDDTSSLENT